MNIPIAGQGGSSGLESFFDDKDDTNQTSSVVANPAVIGRYVYPNATINMSANTALFVDRLLGYKILVTNFVLGNSATNTNIRINVLNKDLKTIKQFNFPIASSVIKSFQINSFDFYPSEYQGTKLLQGELVLRTSSGDLFVDLKELKAEFLFYSKRFFEDKDTDIIIKEVQRT